MPAMKRTTVYFDPVVFESVRSGAARAELSISAFINRTIRDVFEEEEEDQSIFEERRNEPNIPLEDFLADMKRRGKL